MFLFKPGKGRDHPVDDCLRPYGTTGNIYIDRDEFTHPSRDVVTGPEDPAGTGTDSDRNNHLRIRHLVIQGLDDIPVLFVNSAGDKEDISMPGIPGVDDPEPFYVIERCQAGKYLDIASITAGSIIMEDPW
jgi:hypothetical protein